MKESLLSHFVLQGESAVFLRFRLHEWLVLSCLPYFYSSFASFVPHALKGQKLLAQGNGRKQHALEAQKLLAQGNGRKQHALKGQKLLAQGSALGMMTVSKAPCKGKSFVNCLILLKLLPLQGDKFAPITTQGAALG